MKFLHKKYENSAMKTDRLMSIKRSVTDRHENVTDRRLWFFLVFSCSKNFLFKFAKSMTTEYAKQNENQSIYSIQQENFRHREFLE